MTTIAVSRGWTAAAAASSPVIFTMVLMAKHLRRALRRGALPRVSDLPDYLLADIGLHGREVQMATIWGRSRL